MDLINRIFRKFYSLFFGYEPSYFSQELFKNFLYAVTGTGVATILTFGINILGARYMGPSEFGKWNLIGSWAEFLVIIPLFGATAAVPRYLGAATEVDKYAIIGSGFRNTLIFSLISFPLFWLIQLRFRIIPDASLLRDVFIYGIILTFFYLIQSFFQGLKQFKRLSMLWVVSAVGFVGTVIIYLFVLHARSYQSLYLGNVIRLAFMIVAGLVLFGRQLLLYSREKSKQLLHFGSFSMLSVVAGFFSLGSIDNIMLNHYLGSAAVGLYAAYYVAFSVFVSKILNSFLQVFLPMASGHANLRELLQGVISLGLKFGLILYLGLLLMIRLLFIFYGHNYAFDLQVALLLDLNITLYAFMLVVGYIITAKGIKGARYGFFSAAIAALANVGLDVVLIPHYQLLGAVYASLFATLSIIIFQFFVIRSGYLVETT